MLEVGDIGAGDPIEVVERPDHGVTIGLAFRAFTTERDLLADLAPARDALPARNRPKVDAAVAAAGRRLGLTTAARYCPPRYAGSRPGATGRSRCRCAAWGVAAPGGSPPS